MIDSVIKDRFNNTYKIHTVNDGVAHSDMNPVKLNTLDQANHFVSNLIVSQTELLSILRNLDFTKPYGNNKSNVQVIQRISNLVVRGRIQFCPVNGEMQNNNSRKNMVAAPSPVIAVKNYKVTTLSAKDRYQGINTSNNSVISPNQITEKQAAITIDKSKKHFFKNSVGDVLKISYGSIATGMITDHAKGLIQTKYLKAVAGKYYSVIPSLNVLSEFAIDPTKIAAILGGYAISTVEERAVDKLTELVKKKKINFSKKTNSKPNSPTQVATKTPETTDAKTGTAANHTGSTAPVSATGAGKPVTTQKTKSNPESKGRSGKSSAKNTKTARSSNKPAASKTKSTSNSNKITGTSNKSAVNTNKTTTNAATSAGNNPASANSATGAGNNSTAANSATGAGNNSTAANSATGAGNNSTAVNSATDAGNNPTTVNSATDAGNNPTTANAATDAGNNPTTVDSATDAGNNPTTVNAATGAGNNPTTANAATGAGNNPTTANAATDAGNNPTTANSATDAGNNPTVANSATSTNSNLTTVDNATDAGNNNLGTNSFTDNSSSDVDISSVQNYSHSAASTSTNTELSSNSPQDSLINSINTNESNSAAVVLVEKRAEKISLAAGATAITSSIVSKARHENFNSNTNSNFNKPNNNIQYDNSEFNDLLFNNTKQNICSPKINDDNWSGIKINAPGTIYSDNENFSAFPVCCSIQDIRPVNQEKDTIFIEIKDDTSQKIYTCKLKESKTILEKTSYLTLNLKELIDLPTYDANYLVRIIHNGFTSNTVTVKVQSIA